MKTYKQLKESLELDEDYTLHAVRDDNGSLSNKAASIGKAAVKESVEINEKSKGTAIASILARRHNAIANKYTYANDSKGSHKFGIHARAAKRYGNIASGKKAYEEVMNEEKATHIVHLAKNQHGGWGHTEIGSKKVKIHVPADDKLGVDYHASQAAGAQGYKRLRNGDAVSWSVKHVEKLNESAMEDAIAKIKAAGHEPIKKHIDSEWEARHKANRAVGDALMNHIKAKHTAEARDRMRKLMNADRLRRGLRPHLDEAVLLESHPHPDLHKDLTKLGLKHHDPFAHLKAQGIKGGHYEDNYRANHDPKKCMMF